MPADDILDAAKGKGLETVLIVGFKEDGELWVSASTSNIERLVFLCELARKDMLDRATEDEGER